MDQICIKRLEVFAKHGVLPEENVLGQKFLISVTLHCHTQKAGQTDDLSDSINYAQVSECIKKWTENETFHLLERLAQFLAENILLTFSTVEKVDVEIEKPWAPVMLPLETVSVKISRQWSKAYLSIGSNMGDKKKNLDTAVELLKQREKIRVIRQSQWIETEPVGYTQQDNFLNGALALETLYSPEELLEEIHKIEKELKRERVIHWGPRTIDLDILLYDHVILQTEKLTIPHVEMANRLFVLEPMSTIAPYVIHPVFHKTIEQMRKELL